MPMYIIGIAGGTGSGKTTVARKIIESLPHPAGLILYRRHGHDHGRTPQNQL